MDALTELTGVSTWCKIDSARSLTLDYMVADLQPSDPRLEPSVHLLSMRKVLCVQ